MKRIGYSVMVLAAFVGLYGLWAGNMALVGLWIVAEIVGLAVVTQSGNTMPK